MRHIEEVFNVLWGLVIARLWLENEPVIREV